MASRAAPLPAPGHPAAAPAHDAPSVLVNNRPLLTVAVMMATIMQILDTTIANVALPHMQTSLGATPETISWVLTSYIITSAIAIPITGWLSDRFGQRQLFIFSIVTFTLSSMLCGAATSLEAMVAFRALQGISAAFISPLSQTVMLDINRPSQHGRAMAIWGMGIMIGPIMGPMLGGWLTENYSWRWVFYINVPFGIVTTLAFLALLPEKPRRARRFDLFGFSMLALGLASLQLMLDRGTQLDWFDSTEILIEGAVALAALWVFTVHMFTGRNPLFERDLITNPNLVVALGFMLVVGVIMFASMALLPPMLQTLFGYPVLDTGLLMVPRGVGILISMGIAGQLMQRIDPRLITIAGASIATASLFDMAGWSLALNWERVALTGLVQGLGMGLVFIPLNTLAFATLPAHYRTEGASLLNLSRSLGASVSIALLIALLGQSIQISHADLASHITDSSLSMIDPAMAERFGMVGDAAMVAVNQEINRQAAMIAYVNDYWLMAMLNLVAIPLLLLLKRPRPGGPPPPAMGE